MPSLQEAMRDAGLTRRPDKPTPGHIVRQVRTAALDAPASLTMSVVNDPRRYEPRRIVMDRFTTESISLGAAKPAEDGRIYAQRTELVGTRFERRLVDVTPAGGYQPRVKRPDNPDHDPRIVELTRKRTADMLAELTPAELAHLGTFMPAPSEHGAVCDTCWLTFHGPACPDCG